MPQIDQDSCVCMKSSGLNQLRFSQAQRVPNTPKIILGIGNSQPMKRAIRKAHQQPLKKPQRPYSPKAPQFHLDKSTLGDEAALNAC